MNSESFFFQLGNTFTRHHSHLSPKQGLRRFITFYGVSPKICCILWAMIEQSVPETCEPKQLFWALHFLKQYNTESVNRATFKTDEKTFRKYVWIIVDLLVDLDVVSFEERLIDSTPGQSCFTSIDGVDFRIQEPVPFSADYYSHKFKAAALRYEIGIALKTGHIVWKFGGFPAGIYPDLKLARELYVHQVMQGELTFADDGYRDKKYFIAPHQTNSKGHKYIMSRHETVNKRIRQFKVLKNIFYHDMDKHQKCFYAVTNITALCIKVEEPLFSIMNK